MQPGGYSSKKLDPTTKGIFFFFFIKYNLLTVYYGYLTCMSSIFNAQNVIPIFCKFPVFCVSEDVAPGQQQSNF